MTDTPSPAAAIEAALAQNWKEAIRINTALLKETKTDMEALLRLAYAFLKTGQFTQAKKTYQKVLDIDQYNQIAQKNLKKLGSMRRKDLEKEAKQQLSPLMFLEEPGKTKIAECIHMAPAPVLSTLSAGQEVLLKTRNHCVEIRSMNQTYLAALPDDLSFKLLKLIAAGNTYQAIVKSVDKKSLRVFLRELSRGKKFTHQPSFIPTTSYVPFSKTVQAGEGPDMTPTGEDSDMEPSEEKDAEGLKD